MRKIRGVLALFLVLLLAGCASAPSIVEVTAPPLPTATVYPTSTPLSITRDQVWEASLYNQLALDIVGSMPGDSSTLLCMPALAVSVHSLYWAGDESVQQEISSVLGVECTSENQCANAALLLDSLRTRFPDLSLLFRMYAGTGISLNETAMGRFQEYFDTPAAMADLSLTDWGRDLSEEMSLATGGRLSRDISIYTSAAGQTLMVSCAAYDVRWMEAWDESRDKMDSFTLADGTKTGVNLMRSFSSHRIYRAQKGTLAVVPAQYQTELWAILPRTGETVNDLLSSVDMGEFSRWRRESKEEPLGVALPILDMDKVTDCTAALRRNGLHSLSGTDGAYETVGRGFSGVDVVTQCARLRFTHEAAPEAAAPTPTPMSQVITRPKEPNMLTYNRECLLLLVDTRDESILFAVAVRRP